MYICREHPSGIPMACPNRPRGIYLAYAVQALILLAAASSIRAGEYFLGLTAAFAFLLTMAPSLMAKNLRLCLPWEINFLIAVSFYLHVIGHIDGYYVTLAPYYDKLAHLIASATVGLVAFVIALFAERQGDIRLTKPAIIAFILMFTLAAGAVWEIYEFVIDQVFGTNLQFGNTDTMSDLIVDLIGGTIAAVFAAIVLAKGEEERFTRFSAESPRGAGSAEIMGEPIDPARSR